ncbi:hypothetical protein RY831_29455 [Noviherbaspirillum sp. CPCC 100848]|uniref:Replication protein n=1 Tax=Noviherbaspirillum album TaxID=3080276 RepID=A0ABU6JIQ6_9BURK|nr:hypothetical protein [Noviherbaspirillum sp. CPCC 100848]MEC4723288.1 hypothetical protein [Noviherbaspirillum sp. CPCC 100848]
MIDLIILTGVVGSPQEHHWKRLAHVSFSRHMTSKCKPTITYIDSPLTGAQMEVKYRVGSMAGRPTGVVQIMLPLASATVGQNYVHAGLSAVDAELRCATLLCRLLLTTLGFEENEVQSFFHTAEADLIELTWHTATSSPRAALNLLKRTMQVFDALRQVKRRHDVQIRDVDVRIRNGIPGLLVAFKGDDEFRQYYKFHQAVSKSRQARKRYLLSSKLAAHGKEVMREIETHVRNECRVQRQTLKGLGALKLDSWNAEVFRKAIDLIWEKAGFCQESESRAHKPQPRAQLSLQAHATWLRYQAGEPVDKELSPSTFTRHRQSILEAKEVDIAMRGKRTRIQPKSLGSQLQYERRWKPKGQFAALTLCEDTAPAIIEDLNRGLAYITSGEIPAFAAEVERDAWLTRWRAYAEREWLCQPTYAVADHDTTGNRRRPPKAKPRGARGVGSVPVDPDAVDELIYVEGKPLVI